MDKLACIYEQTYNDTLEKIAEVEDMGQWGAAKKSTKDNLKFGFSGPGLKQGLKDAGKMTGGAVVGAIPGAMIGMKKGGVLGASIGGNIGGVIGMAPGFISASNAKAKRVTESMKNYMRDNGVTDEQIDNHLNSRGGFRKMVSGKNIGTKDVAEIKKKILKGEL